MSELQDIVRLAKQARQNIEDLDYPHYPSNLAGACWPASVYLMALCHEAKIYPVLVRGWFIPTSAFDHTNERNTLCYYHWWLEHKKYIIDITATQFDIDCKVYVIDKQKDLRYNKAVGEHIKTKKIRTIVRKLQLEGMV